LTICHPIRALQNVNLLLLASQLITPAPGIDPQQRRTIAIIMPLIFGFTAWSYGSGLALYGACSSLIGVAQQFVMNRTQ
jgi:YidC/Oxa1 family membrane protein insertase